MSDWNQHAHFAALDWASDHHDVVVVDRQGHVVASFRFAHSAAGWKELRERLAAYPAVVIAVETNQGRGRAAVDRSRIGGLSGQSQKRAALS